MRAPDEIAARAFALLAVAVRAESLNDALNETLNSGEPLTPEQLFQRLPAAQAALTPNEREFMADRKSTRLNSSHLVISYAVFCLKKKKTPSPHTHPHERT